MFGRLAQKSYRTNSGQGQSLRTVGAITKRREIVTVPKSNALVARATGLIRPLIEKIGFNDDRIAIAIRRSKEQLGHS